MACFFAIHYFAFRNWSLRFKQSSHFLYCLSFLPNMFELFLLCIFRLFFPVPICACACAVYRYNTFIFGISCQILWFIAILTNSHTFPTILNPTSHFFPKTKRSCMHACTHANIHRDTYTPHASTHTHTQARTHAHARTHARTHITGFTVVFQWFSSGFPLVFHLKSEIMLLNVYLPRRFQLETALKKKKKKKIMFVCLFCNKNYAS